MWVFPVPLLPTAITFSRRATYSQRASSSTNVLLSEGIAANSKLSKLLTVGNRASLMRRSTIRCSRSINSSSARRSEEHTSELQSRQYLVCRLLLEKKNTNKIVGHTYNKPSHAQRVANYFARSRA